MFIDSQTITFMSIVLFAMFLWLSGLSIVFYRLLMHYKRIASRVSEGDLVKLVTKLINSEENNTNEVKAILKELDRVHHELTTPLQKVSIARYNPFAEIGGEHSFSLCILDKLNNGFIVTSLHTRDRTRLYMKPVKSGESKLELSAEELKVLKQAIKK